MGGMKICSDKEFRRPAAPSRSTRIVHRNVICSPLSAITAIATSGDQIAAVHEAGRIRICRRHGRHVIVNYTIPFSRSNRSDYVITAIAWIGTRLLTSDLDGNLTEWNLTRRCPLQTTSSYGGPVFCMVACGSNVVLGCMDGSLRVFDLDALSLSYVRSFQNAVPKVSTAHVTAVAFLDNELVAAAYSSGMVCIYNIVTSHVVAQFAAPSVIKSLCASPDSSALVTGSIDGKLHFWCRNTFTLMETLSTHSAEITAIAVIGDKIVATGLDRKVAYVQTSGMKFIHINTVRYHRSDLLCLAISGDDAILTGGRDGQLFVMIGDQYWTGSPFSHTADCIMSSDGKTFAVMSWANSVEIWRESQLCCRYQCTAGLISMALSPAANLLLTSTSSSSYLFDLQSTSQVNLDIVPRARQQHLPALSHVAFSSDSAAIYAVDIDDQRLRSFNASAGQETKCSAVLSAQCDRMAISPNDDFLAVADVHGLVSIFSIPELVVITSLPRLKAGVSALAFGLFNASTVLACVTADRCLYIFDIARNQLVLSEFTTALHYSQSNTQSRRLLSLSSIVFRLEFARSSPNVLILVSHAYIARLDLNASPELPPTTTSLTEHRAGPKHKPDSRVISCSPALQLLDFHSTPIKMAKLFEDDITVVESSWTQLNTGVMAPLERRRFAKTI